MSATLDAIIRRLIVFACASLGTFTLYLAIGEITGVTDGTAFEFASALDIAVLFGKAVVLLTAGHALALRMLAVMLRGFSVPSLLRSAAAGATCTVVLEMAYMSGAWVSAFSSRGVVRVGLATVVSLVICAIRARRNDAEPEFAASATDSASIEPA